MMKLGRNYQLYLRHGIYKNRLLEHDIVVLNMHQLLLQEHLYIRQEYLMCYNNILLYQKSHHSNFL